LLDPDYCIQYLDLSDNAIHANGCMHLGAHLAENMTCSTLNLRLNRCEDNGVSHLFQDLCVNRYLRSLNLSCNDLSVSCLPYMNQMISENGTLTELDLSANGLLYQAAEEEGEGAASALAGESTVGTVGGPDEVESEAVDALAGISMSSQFAVFARCLMRSQALLRVDIRHCGLPAELAERITTTVKHRELRAKGIPVEAYEQSKLKQEEEIPDEEAVEEGEGEGEGEGETGEELSHLFCA